MNVTLLDLPHVAWHQIAFYLPGPDILSLCTSCKTLHHQLALSSEFWKLCCEQMGCSEDDTVGMTAHETKQRFVLASYCRELPRIQWHAVDRGTYPSAPSAREGHGAVLLGTGLIVLTGGFSDDSAVYIKETSGLDNTWKRLPAGGTLPIFSYGSSWTALDERRILRVGGFTAGGYSGETSQIAILTIDKLDSGIYRPSWEIVNTEPWNAYHARAYHSATLIQNRYLLVLGGMQSARSVWNPAILDCETWTWITAGSLLGAEDGPSPRFGHSAVLDESRSRVVIFGGGNGSDLLRSGIDNSEVWELKFGKTWKNDFLGSITEWRWRKVHADQHHRDPQIHAPLNISAENVLRPSETLNLGRCHACHQVARDTILLIFGSRRPSTNAVLAYSLSSDYFFRPSCEGYLPCPRFTFASVYMEREGYIYVHGGFSSQRGDPIYETCLLDLAPSLSREIRHFRLSPQARSHRRVTDDDAVDERNGRLSLFEQIMYSLEVARTERQQSDAENIPNQHDLAGPALIHFVRNDGRQILSSDNLLNQIHSDEHDHDSDNHSNNADGR